MSQSELSVEGFSGCVPVSRDGSTAVYRAHETDAARQVGIRVLLSLDDSQSIDRFTANWASMSELSRQPGIASVHSSGITSDGYPYLVLPFYEQGSLQDQLDSAGPLEWRSAARQVIEASTAVGIAHQRGIFHGDIKPANLLKADGGGVDIADFGVVSQHPAVRASELQCTPAYTAPEVLNRASSSSPAQADIYALGATLLTLLTAEVPFAKQYLEHSHDTQDYSERSWFDAPDLAAFAEFVSHEPIPDLRDVAPEPICAIIEQAMSKSPQERFSSVAAFQNALRHATRPSAEDSVKKQAKSFAGDGSKVPPPPIGDRKGIPQADRFLTAVLEPGQVPKSASSSLPTKPPPPTAPPGSELPAQAEQQGFRTLLLAITAIVVVVAVAVGALLFAVNSNAVAGGPVGDYVGNALEVAETDALEAAWELEVVRLRKDGSVLDEVLEQSVPAGQELRSGRTLTIRVSDGPLLRDLPELVGTNIDQARQDLENEQLDVGDLSEVFDQEAAPGTIVSATVEGQPAAGQYETATRVDLVVSLGPEEVPIPDISSGQEALATLENELALNVSSVEEFSNSVPAGNVIRTEPAVGQSVQAGDAITVYISRGPRVRDVPNTIGMKPDEAARQLEAAGFVVSVEDRRPNNCRFKFAGNGKRECDNYDDGNVWDYRPNNNRAEFGTTIRIFAKT